MSTYVITGAAAGIGAATAEKLNERGHRVIGVDRTGSEVTADLSTPSGRARAADSIRELAPEGVTGFVPCAGIAGLTGVDAALVVSVNYFGSIDLLEALRPLLVQAAENGERPSVVLLSSNSITCQPGWASSVAAACLGGDEEEARRTASGFDAIMHPMRPDPAT